ncbi:MAG: hypothetical protein ABJZ55_04930 [Fuerstiella sp.]
MSLLTKFQSAAAVLAGCVVVTAVFASGIATGCYFYPKLMGATAEVGHGAHDDHAHEEDAHDHGGGGHERENHVKLTKQAFENIGLTMGSLERSDYWKSLLVPAEVVEIPGRSNLSVSAPISGVVQTVKVLPGEAVGEGTLICDLTITDEALVEAQSSLLNTLSQIDVTETEIARLVPLTESGAVAKKSLIDARYKLQQLQANQDTVQQELKGRGLPEQQLAQLVTDRQLVTALQVSSPKFQLTSSDPSEVTSDNRRGYSIETLHVHPGQTVQRGQDLCDLSYHEELYVQGTAFESDLDLLNRIAENNWSMTVEFHSHLHDEDSDEADHGPLKLNLLRIDNHVDQVSRTVRFYISLPNDVERTITDDSGRVFQQWRHRPGQRVHLSLPESLWSNQLVVPADAVAVDGPNAMIFAKYKVPFHLKGHDDYDMWMELEPVPVRLLHRDNQRAVIATDPGFKISRPIAMNHAHKLHLAMKMQSGAGGDPHAGHTH